MGVRAVYCVGLESHCLLTRGSNPLSSDGARSYNWKNLCFAFRSCEFESRRVHFFNSEQFFYIFLVKNGNYKGSIPLIVIMVRY